MTVAERHFSEPAADRAVEGVAAAAGESDLELAGVTKMFGAVTAVRDISFTARQGEFVSLLGTSGCGKTTTLSMIAGFQTPTAGEIFLRGRRIDHLPPERRNAGMVFQNYALFPHMSVAENVGFGLRMRGVPGPLMRQKIERALDMVRMSSFGARMPSELSGGQQQRVALARALVIEPSILLLDEPLGALDRALRQEMQLELKSLQRSVGITTVFVTHDQEEALSMSDRIVVMSNGRIEQIGSPAQVYERPQTTFVATFMGKSNFFPGEIRGVDDDGIVLDTPLGRIRARRPQGAAAVGDRVEILVRPEKVARAAPGPAAGLNRLAGAVRQIVYQGAFIETHLALPEGQTFLMSQPNCASAFAGEESGDMTVEWPIGETLVFLNGRLQSSSSNPEIQTE